MAPVVHGLEDEYWGQITFTYLNIDNPLNDRAKQQYEFRYQPQFFLLDENGNVIQQWIGSQPREALQEAFDAALAERR